MTQTRSALRRIVQCSAQPTDADQRVRAAVTRAPYSWLLGSSRYAGLRLDLPASDGIVHPCGIQASAAGYKRVLVTKNCVSTENWTHSLYHPLTCTGSFAGLPIFVNPLELHGRVEDYSSCTV